MAMSSARRGASRVRLGGRQRGRAASAPREARCDDEDFECCVCFGPTETVTPCSHPVCQHCWNHLPTKHCPICRRELPTSAGALPVRLVRQSQSGVALPQVRGSTGERRRANSSPTAKEFPLPGSVAMRENFEALPRSLARQVTAVARRGTLRLDGLEAVLGCAEALAPIFRQRPPVSEEQVQAAEHARECLSLCASQSLSNLPLVDARLVLPKLAELVLANLLNREPVYQAMLAGALESVQMPTDSQPGSIRIRWQEAESFVDYAMDVAKHEVFGELLQDMAPHSARQVFDAVQLAPLDQLPVSLRRSAKLYSGWPAATYALTAALRPWLLPRLQQLANRASAYWADDSSSEPSSPVNSPLPKIGSGQLVDKRRPWADTTWWLEVLRTAAINGLLQRSSLLELCEMLTVGFSKAGVKIAEAEKVLRNAQYAAKNDVGSTHVARGLAVELAANANAVRYLPHMRLVLCNCPSFPGDKTESIILNLDSDCKESRSPSHLPSASSSTSSWRGRPPRPDDSPNSTTASAWRNRPPRPDDVGRGRAFVRSASSVP